MATRHATEEQEKESVTHAGSDTSDGGEFPVRRIMTETSSHCDLTVRSIVTSLFAVTKSFRTHHRHLVFCAVALAPLTIASSALADKVAAPSPAALDAALAAHQCAVARGDVKRDVVTLIDYSLPATKKRLWVLDVKTGEVLMHERVTHGKNSGWNFTTRFSNTPESRATSLGVFRIAEIYRGKHGRSLRLDGLERGFNHNARRRAVVIHGAEYAKREFTDARGRKRLGRSWGCPAVRPGAIDDLIDLVAEGSLLVSYANDKEWRASSDYLNCSSLAPDPA